MVGNLNEQWWYRLVQVVYGVMVIGSFTILFLAIYNFRPQEVIDMSKSTFSCTDKDSKNYNQSFGFANTSVYLNDDGTLPKWHESTLNRWCTSGDHLYTGNGTYYSLAPAFKNDQNWSTFLWQTTLTTVGLAIFWLIIRKLFLYIVLGKRNT